MPGIEPATSWFLVRLRNPDVAHLFMYLVPTCISSLAKCGCSNLLPIKKKNVGVPFVAQLLTNPTRNHEVAGSMSGLAQWVKVPLLP